MLIVSFLNIKVLHHRLTSIPDMLELAPISLASRTMLTRIDLREGYMKDMPSGQSTTIVCGTA